MGNGTIYKNYCSFLLSQVVVVGKSSHPADYYLRRYNPERNLSVSTPSA